MRLARHLAKRHHPGSRNACSRSRSASSSTRSPATPPAPSPPTTAAKAHQASSRRRRRNAVGAGARTAPEEGGGRFRPPLAFEFALVEALVPLVLEDAVRRTEAGDVIPPRVGVLRR